MARTDPRPTRTPGRAALSPRERDVLRLVVQHFIDTAAPVGSRVLVEEHELDWSSASVRSTMHALEEAGYLDHPHTSAGRVPTERGYRAYVDELMDVRGLTGLEAELLRETVLRRLGDLDAVARVTSRLLGQLTRLLGVVLTPTLATGVLERIEVVPLSSTRAMFVLAVRGGLARTLVAEVDGALVEGPVALDAVVQRLNERLAGLTLDELRRTGAERLHDLGDADRTGIVRVVLRESARLFGGDPVRRAAVAGVPHLVEQPEFQQPAEIRNVIELVEDEDVIVHLLERPAEFDPAHPERAVVLIGRELGVRREGDAAGYAAVAARYRAGGGVGTVGVIGPTRMDYARAVALVEHVAALLTASAAD